MFDKATELRCLPRRHSDGLAGLYGVRETAGSGDPVVLYDQLVVDHQPVPASVPTDECVAVSPRAMRLVRTIVMTSLGSNFLITRT